jgi:hypothetical protein
MKYTPFASIKEAKYKSMIESGEPVVDTILELVSDVFLEYLRVFSMPRMQVESAIIACFKKAYRLSRQITANSEGIVDDPMIVHQDWFRVILGQILALDAKSHKIPVEVFQRDTSIMFNQLGWGDFMAALSTVTENRSPIEDLLPIPFKSREGADVFILLRLVPAKEFIPGMLLKGRKGSQFVVLYELYGNDFCCLNLVTGKTYSWNICTMRRMEKVGLHFLP